MEKKKKEKKSMRNKTMNVLEKTSRSKLRIYLLSINVSTIYSTHILTLTNFQKITVGVGQTSSNMMVTTSLVKSTKYSSSHDTPFSLSQQLNHRPNMTWS